MVAYLQIFVFQFVPSFSYFIDYEKIPCPHHGEITVGRKKVQVDK